MSTDKTLILVTGGNIGIGFELVAQLLTDSAKHVFLGSRSVDKGEAAVKELQSRNLPGSVELLQLDVANHESIDVAAKTIAQKYGRLDALVNNAAIAMPSNESLARHVSNQATGPMPSGPLAEFMAECFRTNATGPLLTVETFRPLLEKAKGTPRIVNVSSGAGSIGRRLHPQGGAGDSVKSPWYRASKAAMNMIAALQAFELGPKGFKVFTFCPGFTVSNLSPFNKRESGAKPTSQGAAPIVKMLNGEEDESHGKFVHEENGLLIEYPW